MLFFPPGRSFPSKWPRDEVVFTWQRNAHTRRISGVPHAVPSWAPQAGSASSDPQRGAVTSLSQFGPETSNPRHENLNRKLHFSDLENEEEEGREQMREDATMFCFCSSKSHIRVPPKPHPPAPSRKTAVSLPAVPRPWGEGRPVPCPLVAHNLVRKRSSKSSSASAARAAKEDLISIFSD